MQTKKNAIKLRKLQTPEEQKLWSRLKNRRLGEYKFRRQITIGGIIVDFCCFEKRLVIELDGYQHLGKKTEDLMRDNYLKSEGFIVLRFWNGEINKNLEKVLDQILSELESPSSALYQKSVQGTFSRQGRRKI